MGFREKVTLSLVIVIILQITCRQCMPSTPRKSTLKGYPNNYKPINPKTPTFPPTQAIKSKKNTLGKQQTSKAYNPLPNKSLYKTYNFPENDYPLETSPKDFLNFGKNYNAYNKVNTPRKNFVSSDINNLKREMKMKRKLTNNRQLNVDKLNTNNEMSQALAKLNLDTEPRVLDPATFPDVQYPTNTMETWAPNYWNYLSLSQNDQQKVYPKPNEINRTPTRLTKAKAYHYLQPYKKLKEEREYSKASSKRSHPGGQGLNFTKTATSEKNSEDIITTSLISDANKIDIEVKSKSENSSDYLIPNKVENKENLSVASELQNNTITKENNSEVQTAPTTPQDYTKTSSHQMPDNLSNDTHKMSHQPTTNTFNDINNDVPLSGDTPTNMSRANCSVDEPTDKLIIPITNDPNTASGLVQNNMPSTDIHSSGNIITNNVGPLNVQMPLSYGNQISNINDIITSANYASALTSGNTGSGTSIIIIPINNGVNNQQSDSPIILYIPTNPLSRDTPVPNYLHNNNSSETMSDISNNTTLSLCSNITQTFNDNPTANAFVSELPLSGASSNYVTNSGSQLPIFESLPRNSMCYNNANCPSSFGEHSSLSNPNSKSLTNSLQSKIPASGTIAEQQSEMQNATFEDQPSVFNFPYSDLTLLSEDLYSQFQNDELPITAREVASDTSKPNIDNAGNVEPTVKSSLDTEHQIISVNNSAKVKKAFKNATLTLFPTDKQSLPVYNAVLKVLLSNATIRSMLSKKRQPSEYMPKENNGEQDTNPNGFPSDDKVLLLTPSNITTNNSWSQTVNKSSSHQISEEKQHLSQTKTILQTPSHGTAISNQFDPESLSDLKDEYTIPNETVNEGTKSLPLSGDFTIIPVSKTLEINSNSEFDNDSIPHTKSNSFLSDDNTQSKLTPIDEFLTPVKTSEKRKTTLFPPLSGNKMPTDSDNNISEAFTENQAKFNLAMNPKTAQWSEKSSISIANNSDRLESMHSSPYNGSDFPIDTEEKPKMLINTDLDNKNRLTKLSETPNKNIVLDDQFINGKISSDVEKIALDPTLHDDFEVDLTSMLVNEKNNATSTDNVTARDNIHFSKPLSSRELPDEKDLDTLDDMARSTDSLTLLTDKATKETLFSTLNNDLSVPLDTPHTVDEPQLKVYQSSFVPIYGQSLLKDNQQSNVVKGDDDPLIDSKGNNWDLPPLSYSKEPINIEESNTSTEILVEGVPGIANDLLSSLDNEYLERQNSSDMQYFSYHDQPYSGVDTSNNSFPILLDDWTHPLDEILHNITLLENNHSTSQPEENLTYTSYDPTDLITPLKIDDLAPNISKGQVPLAPEDPTYISTPFEEIPQGSEIAEPSKLKDETQEDSLLDRKEIEMLSDKSLSDIFDVSNLTEEDGEESLPYPENLTEHEENSREVKSRRPLSLPMAKAILENVLFNIYTGGLSIPVPKRDKKRNKLPTVGVLKGLMNLDN